MNPFDYCTDKVAKRGTALFYATFQLPEAKRQAVAAIHAFRQEVQEAVVDISDPALGTVKLQWWRNQIAAAFDGTPQHPVALALQALVRTYTLPAQHFLAVIDGIEGDLAMPRYPDLATLVRYCDLTGAVPNALAAEILGYRDTRTIDCVRDLGTACALACVVRDVGRAARRDRIYLPADEMARFSVTPADLIHGRYSDRFRALVEHQIDRIERRLATALGDLPAIDRPSQRPVLALAAIARALLREIRIDGCRVLDRHTTLTPLRKLWIAWRAR